MRSLGLLTLLFMTSVVSTAQQSFSRLIHQNWEFKQADSGAWRSAVVPGCVHTDLLDHSLLKDPFYRKQEEEAQWIDKKNWVYRTEVDLSADQCRFTHLELEFKGLDTRADVYWDGELLLTANNAFRTWKVLLPPALRTEGKHILRIFFHSPIEFGLREQGRYGTKLPAINDQSDRGEVEGNRRVSPYVRKPPYHFGWDWGPRLVTSGIWKPVTLNGWNDIRITDLFIRQDSVSSEFARLTAVVTLDSDSANSGDFLLSLNGVPLDEFNRSWAEGSATIEIPFGIESPRLWWTHDLGEAYQYEFGLSVISGNKLIGNRKVKTGLRDIRLLIEEDAEGQGSSFGFQLNGVPLFAKGANYIPQDIFPTRVSSADNRRLIQSSRDANMNMIRIWGGGIYESDDFYAQCDEAGILIWQDFMFACSMYPGNEEFLENVAGEARDQVIRLRNHPCIALWCGNNEIDLAWAQFNMLGGWGWKQRYRKKVRTKIWQANTRIFHEILPQIVEEFAPQSDYWPSSPYEKEGGHSTNTSISGDMHYWGVWHAQHPFKDFHQYVGRFMSEYGFQSFPEFETVKSYTTEEDWDIESEVMAAHQRSGIGNLRIRSYMADHYVIPERFEDQLYVGQLLQAKGITTAIEAHRFARPYCMGTLYWQLNDCWPVASWSGLDYYYRWKALHFAVQKAFEPVIIGLKPEEEGTLIFAASDKVDDLSGFLTVELVDFSGKTQRKTAYTVVIPALSAIQVGVLEEVLAPGFDQTQSVLRLTMADSNGTLITQKLHYFLPEKDLKLAVPHLTLSHQPTSTGFSLEISTDVLAKNVYLQAVSGTVFSHNFIDILPGESQTIQIETPHRNWEELQLRIKTLVETLPTP